ncbi:Methylated-DNA--protein-cysteine methyltransferase [subsurface metagenome]
MTRGLEYITFNTSMGWVGVLGSVKGLLRTTLPQDSTQKAYQLLVDSTNYATWSPRLFEDLMARLRAYFDGRRTIFPDELDLSKATPFQREVWEITRLIPYGETRSYIWVAHQIKRPKAVRAVGQALSRNRLPVIVPCHRVLTIDGALGGFSGGVDIKRQLLFLEAAPGIR